MNLLNYMLKNIVLKKPYNLFFFLSFLTFNFSFGQITEIDLQLAQKYFIDQDYEKAHLYYEKIAKEPQYLSKIYKNFRYRFSKLYLQKIDFQRTTLISLLKIRKVQREYIV